MNLELSNKRAFISGSSSGIGYATAKKLLEEGAEVIINGRSEESVEKALTKLRNAVPEGKVSGLAADFSDVKSVDHLIEKLGAVDILINNVGIYESSNFVEIADEDWYRFLTSM